MMMSRSVALALAGGAMLAAGAGPALGQSVKPVCRDNSRACLLKTAGLYLDGLSRHDASAIPFAPDVRCTEQANIPVTDEKTFRSEIDSSKAIAGIRNLRLMADPETASVGAFYILDIAGEGGKPDYTVRRGQRFKIVGGLVREVEVFNYVDPALVGRAAPLWPD